MLGSDLGQGLAILGRMGETLLQIQMTERVLKICIHKFIPKDGQSFEDLLATDLKSDKWTLGAFLAELRRRREIDTSFDDVLREFLKDRNDFIHNIFEVPGFKLGADPEPDKAMLFLTQLAERAVYVRNVLKAYMDIIAESLGLTGASSRPLDILNNPADFHKLIALMTIKHKASL